MPEDLTMRDVAIVSFAQAAFPQTQANEPEMLLPVLDQAVEQVGLTKQDIGFTCSGSSDYLAGAPFSFVAALDAVGAWPPIAESHVEMDGAWALYEAWLWLLSGDADTALVYAFGKTSPSDVSRTLALQLEPYSVAPLNPTSHAMAGLQARALLASGRTDEDDLAAIAARCHRDAVGNPYAVRSGDLDASDVLGQAVVADPLREGQTPPVTDGCAAIVLAAGDRARELTDNPAWIRGMDHRIDAQALGVRDLTRSQSAQLAAAGVGAADGPIDIAELHTRYAHEEVILRDALGLNGSTRITPSGGALTSDPFMATGLVRIGSAAEALRGGHGQRGLAHAQGGPCLQQNLVTILEVA
jgi:acetyl-CoA acetyltransferase